MATALPINVTLYEESPVLEIGANDGFWLACPDSVVVCTNLYSWELGIFKHWVVPFGELRLLPVNANANTARLTRDRRIYMRNSLHYACEKRFPPELMAGVAINH